MKTRSRLALPTVALLLVAACGEGDLVPYETWDDTPPQPAPTWQLELTGPGALALTPYGLGTITARLLKNGTPAPDVDTRWAVDGDLAGGRLSAVRGRTDAAGESSVEVIAGGGTTTFAVTVATDHTAPVRVEVRVAEPEVAPGALRIRVAYPDQGRQPVKEVVISLNPGTVHCDAVGSLLPTALDARPLRDLSGTLLFDDLDAAEPLTVIGLGSNDAGVVADGCLENVRLTAGAETRTTLELGALPLDATGTYDLASVYDFADAIPGATGDLIATVARIFDDPDDPGRYLVELVEDRLGFDFGFLHETAVDIVQGFVQKWVPERFLRLFQFIGDAARAVTHLGVEAILDVERAPTGELVGHESWDVLVFQWRGDCDPAAAPGCDVHRVALRNTHLGYVDADYPVEVRDGRLGIGTHTRTIEYARMFHVFVTQVVYPYVAPGATSTGDVLQASVDCAGVAAALDEADGVADGILDLGVATPSVQELEGVCGDVLQLAGLAVDAKLDDLARAVPSEFTLEGSARVVDADRSLVPEAFEDGVWEGGLTLDGDAYPVTGTFEAVRR